MAVPPLSNPVAPAEPPGYLETFVQAIAARISRLLQPLFDRLGWFQTPAPVAPAAVKPVEPKPKHLFEKQLLGLLRRQALDPAILLRQFKRYVAKEQQAEIYEGLGRGRELGLTDRLWHWLASDESGIKARYRGIGELLAKQDPYLLAPALQRALKNKVTSSPSS